MSDEEKKAPWEEDISTFTQADQDEDMRKRMEAAQALIEGAGASYFQVLGDTTIPRYGPDAVADQEASEAFQRSIAGLSLDPTIVLPPGSKKKQEEAEQTAIS